MCNKLLLDQQKDISEACLNLRRKLGQNQNQLKYMNDFEANLKEAFLSHRIHLKNLEFKNDQKNCHGEMPGVQPKKTSPVNLKSRFHLPMYNPARGTFNPYLCTNHDIF